MTCGLSDVHGWNKLAFGDSIPEIEVEGENMEVDETGITGKIAACREVAGGSSVGGSQAGTGLGRAERTGRGDIIGVVGVGVGVNKGWSRMLVCSVGVSVKDLLLDNGGGIGDDMDG